MRYKAAHRIESGLVRLASLGTSALSKRRAKWRGTSALSKRRAKKLLNRSQMENGKWKMENRSFRPTGPDL
jgi:hypothetical protein